MLLVANLRATGRESPSYWSRISEISQFPSCFSRLTMTIPERESAATPFCVELTFSWASNCARSFSSRVIPDQRDISGRCRLGLFDAGLLRVLVLRQLIAHRLVQALDTLVEIGVERVGREREGLQPTPTASHEEAQPWRLRPPRRCRPSPRRLLKKAMPARIATMDRCGPQDRDQAPTGLGLCRCCRRLPRAPVSGVAGALGSSATVFAGLVRSGAWCGFRSVGFRLRRLDVSGLGLRERRLRNLRLHSLLCFFFRLFDRGLDRIRIGTSPRGR